MGNGKRANVLSDYTFAEPAATTSDSRRSERRTSGLTDAEIAEPDAVVPADHRLPAVAAACKGASAHEIPVAPKVVIEVAFDVVQKSELARERIFALRFPRIVRLRDDKPVEEIDTLERVREIYAENARARERRRALAAPA